MMRVFSAAGAVLANSALTGIRAGAPDSSGFTIPPANGVRSARRVLGGLEARNCFGGNDATAVESARL